MKPSIDTVVTFTASVLFGCVFAIAVASVAAVSEAAPSLRPAPADVVRLEPVVVTVSKAYYDAVRAESAAVARNDGKRITRG